MVDPFAGLTPPPYWRLAVLACLGQGLWAVRLAWARLRGRRPEEVAGGFGFLAFAAGALAGLAYGWLQHDAVFVVGQGVALGLGLLWRRAVNKDETK